jgi:hypothetical protein
MLTFILLGEGSSNVFSFELNYDLKMESYEKEIRRHEQTMQFCNQTGFPDDLIYVPAISC